MNNARSAVFTTLWTDGRYLQLMARKDARARAWNEADARKRPEAPVLLRRFKAACRRIQKYEDAALARAGL